MRKRKREREEKKGNKQYLLQINFRVANSLNIKRFLTLTLKYLIYKLKAKNLIFKNKVFIDWWKFGEKL